MRYGQEQVSRIADTADSRTRQRRATPKMINFTTILAQTE